jgi:hypothetical protein
MRIVLNGKVAKNVTVTKHEGKYIGYEIRNMKGKRWSLIRNRNNPNLLGVVNHGSINNHKFRGYEWFTDSAEGTLLGLNGAY